MITRWQLFLTLLVFLVSGATGLKAQDKKFTIRWFGRSFFQIETPAGKRIVIDPHFVEKFGRPEVTADLILATHEHDDHNRREAILNGDKAKYYNGLKLIDKKKTIYDWNRLDEKFEGMTIKTVPTYHDEVSGMKRGKNSIFVLEIEGLRFVHLGDLGHSLSEAQLRAIGKVDVLFLPIGGIYTINGTTAARVMKQLKPRLFVLPMHYAVEEFEDTLLGADEFLDEVKNVKSMKEFNELAFPANLKVETPSVVLLGWKKAQ